MSTGKVLLGLLAGIAAGATLGILFAPEKGIVTRKRIAKKGDDYMDELESKFNDLVYGINSEYKSVKEKVAHLLENGKAEVEEMQKHAVLEKK
jgi:gas vesicle protein